VIPVRDPSQIRARAGPPTEPNPKDSYIAKPIAARAASSIKAILPVAGAV
jgi:hypothetical protein